MKEEGVRELIKSVTSTNEEKGDLEEMKTFTVIYKSGL